MSLHGASFSITQSIPYIGYATIAYINREYQNTIVALDFQFLSTFTAGHGCHSVRQFLNYTSLISPILVYIFLYNFLSVPMNSNGKTPVSLGISKSWIRSAYLKKKRRNVAGTWCSDVISCGMFWVKGGRGDSPPIASWLHPCDVMPPPLYYTSMVWHMTEEGVDWSTG